MNSIAPQSRTAKEAWSVRFAHVRDASTTLAGRLSAEDQQVQSMPDASPAKWHLAHTTWFFETFLLRPHLPGYVSADERFDVLFNSYYEALGPRTPRHQRGLITRPSVREVAEYRSHVDDGMRRLLAGHDDALPEALSGLVELGLNHEQQHQELLLMDIKHLLSCNPLQPAYAPVPPDRVDGAVPTISWMPFDGGKLRIGHDSPDFAFDNEGPRHTVWLEPFSLADRLVSNGEYRGFIDAGGYRDHRLWLSDGWATVRSEGWAAPFYWRTEDDGFSEFTLHGRRSVRMPNRWFI